MKKKFAGLLFLVVWIPSGAQVDVEKLIEQGVAYADQGLYEKAIEAYLQVEQQLPENDMLLYEIASCYYYLEDYPTAIQYAEKTIRFSKQDYLVTSAILIKGNSLDLMGQTQEAIDFYLTMIDIFPEENMLYYNLAYTYYTQELFKEAEAYVVNSISMAYDHSSSHLLLAYTTNFQQKRVQTWLALHFFLLLEPFTDRSMEAYMLLQEISRKHVAVDENNANSIQINHNPHVNEEFATAEMMISLVEASLLVEKNKSKTDEELFVVQTGSIFKILGEMGEKREESDDFSIWWDFYIPLFYEIAKTEHIETYCMFITQGVNPQAKEWLDAHPEKLEAFSQWALSD